MEDFFGGEPHHILFAVAGALVILAHWLPRFVSPREPASAALVIALGAAVFAFVPGMPAALDPRTSPLLWEIVAEIAVIAALFGTGIRIDDLSDWRRWTPTLRLLVFAMPLTIAAVAALGAWWAGFTLAGAILVGAVLSPTDPVLAGDVQVGPPHEGGEHPVRFTLTTEAGLNDGLAFPFVYLGLALAAGETVFGPAGIEWFARDVVYRIAVGVLLGAAIGWLLAKSVFTWPADRPLADTAAGVVALGGILLSYGGTELAEGYGFVAVFVTGLTLRRMEHGHGFHRRLHDFSGAIEHALTVTILVLLGGALPALFADLTWAHVGIALALIVLVRPAVGWLSLAGSDLTGRERWIVAIYGVRGVGSIYYLAYAAGKYEFLNEHDIWALVGFAVLASTVLHGLTAAAAVERVLPPEPKAPRGG